MSKHKKKEALAPKQASGIALAAGWPVHEVLVSQGWNQTNALASVLIARRLLKTGRVAAASFLVDLACLGIKQTQVQQFRDVAEYIQGIRAHLTSRQPMIPADFNLAAKIVITGVQYAAQFGFRPDAVYAQSEYLLAGADPEASTTPVPTGGPEGKPHFINGPYDDVQKVINQLTRTAGVGNFHYTIQGPDGLLGFDDI